MLDDIEKIGMALVFKQLFQTVGHLHLQNLNLLKQNENQMEMLKAVQAAVEKAQHERSE